MNSHLQGRADKNSDPQSINHRSADRHDHHDQRTVQYPSVSSRATPLERTAWFLLGFGAWAVIVTATRLYPDPRGFGTHQQLGLPPCEFTSTFGIPCPGCGLTTSFAHMVRGHLVDAFRTHWMGPPLFVITLSLALYAPYAIVRARPLSVLFNTRLSLPALVFTALAGLLMFILRLIQFVR